MSIKKISAMAIAGLMTIGVVSVFAQDAFVAPATPEEAVTMRQQLMKQDGGLMRTLAGLTGAEAAAALQTMLTNYTHIPALFPEGSIGDSKALPAIWENWDAFNAIVETGKTAATDGIAAAEAGDAAAYAAALKTLGGTCGQCHQQFRG
ncbi:c-type cytochrome [uncultured Devosia sp.]|uniref:c-type cytochrome n=1 Tax=uncultured Devosia sp. TaxID=211434 RepID=UPI0035CA294E